MEIFKNANLLRKLIVEYCNKSNKTLESSKMNTLKLNQLKRNHLAHKISNMKTFCTQKELNEILKGNMSSKEEYNQNEKMKKDLISKKYASIDKNNISQEDLDRLMMILENNDRN